MKKFLSLMLAALLALSCFAALAEEPQETGVSFQMPSLTVTEELTVDAETVAALLPMLGMPEENLSQIQAILPILSSLTQKLVVADKGIQFDLGLKGQSVAAIACEQTENGFALASDLIPSYVITVSNDTIQQMIEQATSQANEAMADVDAQKLIESLTGYIMQYMGACVSAVSMGDIELGEYTFEGMDYTFNAKSPINVDTEAIKAAAETFIAQLKNNEGIASLLSSLEGSGVNVSLEENVNMVLPEIDCVAYTNVDEEGNPVGETTYVVTETKTEAEGETVNVNVYVLVEGSNVNVNVAIPQQNTNVYVRVLPTGSGAEVDCDLTAQGMYVGFKAVFSMGDTMELSADVYFMNTDKPILNDKVVVAQGGERTMTVLDEGKEELSLEALMQDEDGQLKTALLMDVMSNGLNSLLGKAAEIMPEEVTALMTMLMGAGQETVTE